MNRDMLINLLAFQDISTSMNPLAQPRWISSQTLFESDAEGQNGMCTITFSSSLFDRAADEFFYHLFTY